MLVSGVHGLELERPGDDDLDALWGITPHRANHGDETLVLYKIHL